MGSSQCFCPSLQMVIWTYVLCGIKSTLVRIWILLQGLPHGKNADICAKPQTDVIIGLGRIMKVTIAEIATCIQMIVVRTPMLELFQDPRIVLLDYRED